MSRSAPDMAGRFLELAIEEALVGVRSRDGGPFGAVVVRAGQVIARGHNRVTSSNDPTAHAEVEAIRAACRLLGTFELSGCELYASCEPCPMCLGAILWARLDRTCYAATRADAAAAGFDDAAFYAQLELAPEARSAPVLHAPTARAAAPFDAWLALEGRTAY